MKQRWLFVLGRQADIALAELTSVLKIERLQYRPDRVGSHELIIETDAELGDPQALLNKLGGVIKIVKLDDRRPLQHPERFGEPVKELLKGDELMRSYMQPSGRWTFGFSVYAPDYAPVVKDQLRDWVHKIGIKVKMDVKSRKRSARFVAARDKDLALSSVVVRKNGLVSETGTDIVLILHQRNLERGKTVAVQDFEAYGARDYGRPARDPKVGSLPPKLAQAMVNLAEVAPGGMIYDPFVGTGTIIQEALLRGHSAAGSDVSEDMVAKAKTNIAWLGNTYRSGLPGSQLTVAAADKFNVLPASIDAIVTEGTLGPPRSRPLERPEAQAIAADISELWRRVLKHVKLLLKPGGTVVLTWPVYATSDGSEVAVNLLDELPALGYRVRDLLTSPEGRSSLRYERPGQVVRRQLYRLTLA